MSDAKKAASQRWDKEHMVTLTCRVTKARAERFKAACAALATNPNAEFLKAINKVIQDAEDRA
jgi:hypothetical protein